MTTREEAIERLAAVLWEMAPRGMSEDEANDRANRAIYTVLTGYTDGLRTRQAAERIIDALGLTVAPPPSEKDAEIARLRGENEKLRGVRVALADLQVSDEVRDQLAAIEREVREAHAQEIASLRAEVARNRAFDVALRDRIVKTVTAFAGVVTAQTGVPFVVEQLGAKP